MDRRDKPLGRTLLFLLWGPILWGLHQAGLYAAQSSLCAWDANLRVGGTDLVTLAIIAATLLLAGGVLLGLAFGGPAYRRLVWRGPGDATDGLIVAVMRLLALLSLAGILWLGLAGLALPSCAALR